jgi:hypothetical protein
MKTNSQVEKGFKLFPEEQPCSQRNQGLSCLEEQPYSKRKKSSFSLRTWFLYKEKPISPKEQWTSSWENGNICFKSFSNHSHFIFVFI